jgi:23S rRNA (adenine2503-C2)-methyltransferase
MLAGVNDSQTQARRLSEWLKGVASPKYFTVNLIPYNSTVYDYKSPDKERVTAFSNLLTLLNVTSTIRKSLGADIVGACGQLADK